jgi:hypothetical protein
MDCVFYTLGAVFHIRISPLPEPEVSCRGDVTCTENTAIWAGVTVQYVPPRLTLTTSTFCPQSVFVCFVWIWEQTAIISLYSTNWLVLIIGRECVFCAVRAEPLNAIQVNGVGRDSSVDIAIRYGLDSLGIECRFQLPSGLRGGPVADRLQGFLVRILPWALMFVSCVVSKRQRAKCRTMKTNKQLRMKYRVQGNTKISGGGEIFRTHPHRSWGPPRLV